MVGWDLGPLWWGNRIFWHLIARVYYIYATRILGRVIWPGCHDWQWDALCTDWHLCAAGVRLIAGLRSPRSMSYLGSSRLCHGCPTTHQKMTIHIQLRLGASSISFSKLSERGWCPFPAGITCATRLQGVAQASS